MNKAQDGRGALAAGGLAALLASACCLGPLVLLSLGIGGAWIANLTALEPYRPYFLAAAVLALAFAARRVFRPAVECKPDEVCAVPQVRTGYKLMFGAVSLLVLVGFAYPYIAPYYY
jgi:mercuric ion transport protein